jgi:hypothetical protein
MLQRNMNKLTIGKDGTKFEINFISKLNEINFILELTRRNSRRFLEVCSEWG